MWSEKSSWPGVSSRLNTAPPYSKVITEVTTEMPRARSMAIQSDRVLRPSRLALTWPASWMAPPNSSSFSVSVVLPASGWEMMANVRRRAISRANPLGAAFAAFSGAASSAAVNVAGVLSSISSLDRCGGRLYSTVRLL